MSGKDRPPGDPDAARRAGGERPAVMTEWAGQAPAAASMTGIEQWLRELGPGSSAVVGFDREDWPPSNDGLGVDENGMPYSDAIYFTPDGKVVHHDHQ